jgi:hypothetical protein
MNIDPSINHVVFEFEHRGGRETGIASVPTRSNAFVRIAWQQVSKESSIRESDVRRIYSEWEPSKDDLNFIHRTFPNPEVTHSFSRPLSDEHWEAALAKAAQTIKQVAEDKAAAQEQRTKPLPILRDSDEFSEIIINFLLAPNLSIFLADVGLTPHGTIGIDYLLYSKLSEQALTEQALWNEAFANLTQGLVVHKVTEKNQNFFILEREGGFAASAIGLIDFSERASSWVGSPRVLIGIPNPDTLLICAADSSSLEHIRTNILKSDYHGSVNLTPCLVLLEGRKVKLLEKR